MPAKFKSTLFDSHAVTNIRLKKKKKISFEVTIPDTLSQYKNLDHTTYSKHFFARRCEFDKRRVDKFGHP